MHTNIRLDRHKSLYRWLELERKINLQKKGSPDDKFKAIDFEFLQSCFFEELLWRNLQFIGRIISTSISRNQPCTTRIGCLWIHLGTVRGGLHQWFFIKTCLVRLVLLGSVPQVEGLFQQNVYLKKWCQSCLIFLDVEGKHPNANLGGAISYLHRFPMFIMFPMGCDVSIKSLEILR